MTEGFLKYSDENLNYHGLLKWLETEEPKCAVAFQSLDPLAQNAAAASRRQAIFFLLGSATPVELYIDIQTGKTTDTRALCEVGRKLLQPNKLEHFFFPGSRTVLNWRTAIRSAGNDVMSFIRQAKYKSKEALNTLTPSVSRVGITLGSILVASLVTPSMTAASLVGIPTYASSAWLSWKFGQERRSIALVEMRADANRLKEALTDGVWSVETIESMRAHAEALRALDIKLQASPISGVTLLKRSIENRKNTFSSKVRQVSSHMLPPMLRDDQLLQAYEALLDEYNASEATGYFPNDKINVFRSSILKNPAIYPMLRPFHFFDHLGHQRGRQQIIKAFVIQEKSAEIVFAYTAPTVAHREARQQMEKFTTLKK